MNNDTLSIVQKANKIVKLCGTRDPYRIADQLGIGILHCNFQTQKGAYKVLLRNRFIFLNNSLPPAMERIVLWHELGHDTLHREAAIEAGGFQEFNLFNMTGLRMFLLRKAHLTTMRFWNFAGRGLISSKLRARLIPTRILQRSRQTL